LRTKKNLDYALSAAPSTMNVVQEHYASNEGLTRMHMDHAVTIDGGNMHLKVAWWSNSGDQDRCTGG